MVTSFFMPRGAGGEQAEAGLAPYEYPAKEMGASAAANTESEDDPDLIIATSGMLNRLELLNF